MSTLLIALHVLTAILFLGPVTVAVSTFQSQMLAAASQSDAAALGAAKVLHRISNTYGYLSAIVPVIGVGIFLSDISTYGKQGQFHASIVLAIIAWALLFFLILPKQKKTLAALEGHGEADFAKEKKTLSALGGIFSLIWLIIAVLMFL